MVLKDILNTFQPLFKRGDDYRLMQLAKDLSRKKTVLLNLQEQTTRLTKKDIGSWLAAWQMAISVDNPKRASLYDVYSNALIDNHLSGCIDQRKGWTLQKDFAILNADGSENENVKKLFDAEWFNAFLDLALDAKYWGHSLIQFGDVTGSSKDMRFENIELVPRKHVVQEFGLITPEPSGDLGTGIPYRTGKIADWCVEVGNPLDLGLLLKVAPQCLSKKNMLAYWDVFGEIFGMPIRVATTPSQNESDWRKISDMLGKLGAAGWALFPEGVQMDIKETTKGDAFNVYDKRVDRCNSEISKAILSQTMTIDSGSSLSQSEVHLEVFNNLCKADATFIRHIINRRLIPLMEKHGFPVAGCRFAWDEAASYTPAEQREMERMLLAEYDIEPEYFIEKYKIPIIGKKSPSLLDAESLKLMHKLDADFFG